MCLGKAVRVRPRGGRGRRTGPAGDEASPEKRGHEPYLRIDRPGLPGRSLRGHQNPGYGTLGIASERGTEIFPQISDKRDLLSSFLLAGQNEDGFLLPETVPRSRSDE